MQLEIGPYLHLSHEVDVFLYGLCRRYVDVTLPKRFITSQLVHGLTFHTQELVK